MNPPEEPKGAGAPQAGTASSHSSAEDSAGHPEGTIEPTAPLDSYDDGYPHEPDSASPAEPAPVSPPVTAVATVPRPAGGGGKAPPPPPPSGGGGGDDDGDDDGMLRMSFLGHLEELRTRIIRALMGVAVAFAVSL